MRDKRFKIGSPHLAHPGYIFLISVLFITVIAISVVGSYLLLSISSLQNGLALQQATQAVELASTCAERSLHALMANNGYAGGEEFSFTEGECYVYPVGGYGNENRTICTEGISGAHTRRMEIVILRILPSVQVFSWREVGDISACSL